MVTVADIVKHMASLIGRDIEIADVVLHGSADTPVTGAVVCWIPTPEAIEDAGARGAELVIGHECLCFPHMGARHSKAEDLSESWAPNKQRRELLDKHALAFLQLHGSADMACVFDDFAAILGLGEPVHEDGLTKVYEIPPRRLGDLIEDVKARVHMDHVRVAGAHDLDKQVHRVGLPWGGVGLFVNVPYQQRLIELGCDVFIAGESDNYGMRFSSECGIPMIETSHEVSENPGLRHLTEILAQAFPDVQFHFHENACAWKWF